MDIAKVLKERRLALGISQEKLAEHCGFAHRANISRIESGKIQWKYRDVLKACQLLKLKIEIIEEK